jgi:hypothetical protein
MSISALVEKEFDLDFTDRNNDGVPAIDVVREDAGSTKFTMTIKNNGVAIDLTDLIVRIYFKKADGTYTQGEPDIDDAINGIVSYSLQSNDTAMEGTVLCQVIITDGTGNQISTFTFTFTVQASIYDDAAVVSTTEFNSLTLLADNLRHKGVYDAGTTYYMNNIVEYNGSSYMALQTTVGNAPPTYPTQCNDYWCTMANGYAFDAEYAANITVADAAGYYSSTSKTAETIFAEVGQRLGSLEYVGIAEVTSTSYTVASTDNEKFVGFNNSTGMQIIVPDSTNTLLPKGFQMIGQWVGVGQPYISYSTNVTVRSAGSMYKASEQYSVFGLVHTSTADIWAMFGDRTV